LIDVLPNPSVSLTSALGGAYFLVQPGSPEIQHSVKRDRAGCSIPGRMALYVSKLLATGLDVTSLSTTLQAELLVCFCLTAEVVSDQLTAMDENRIWKTLDTLEASSDAEYMVSSARKTLNSLAEDAPGWRDGSEISQSRVAHDVFNQLINAARQLTPLGLYNARVLSELLQSLMEKHSFPSSAEEWLTKLDILNSSPGTVLPAISILTGLGDSLSVGKAVGTFCNRLVSDVAGAKHDSEKSLATLALLNACMSVYEIGELPVANNRLVFAVRQITSWLETPEQLDYRFAAEACRCLRHLLPCIKDVYGSYWERSIDFCIYLWTTGTSDPLAYQLPYIHASLRLIMTLKTLEEPNDDLVDALESASVKLSNALIELLRLPREKETQPLEIIDAIVCRQVEKLPLEHVEDISDLYGLVASESRAIQTAAFGLLHRALPAAQEKLSVDVLLDKKNAQLPDELLSLLLEAPTLDAFSDEALALFPTPIRSYLLTWHLVFDAFKAASFKVRGDYAENLKASNYIGPLMDFTFDVLGHSAAHSLNLDKANFTVDQIRDYDLKLAEADAEERNMQWLLIHLYYLVLKFVPGLFKSWFIDCRSKQTKISVESWMVKYFSPIIVSEALDDVAQWAETQEPPADDEQELVVKVSRAAKEVTAGYEVDESQASIAIKIPPAYPLEGVSVVGLNRVAVNEKKWQSWIMTTQGVITFSVSLESNTFVIALTFS
jgi:E3 ubiquitin-protein ligase listerin